MNSIVSAVMTWPGTMIGKPGGYGMTKFADTSGGPSFKSAIDLLVVQRNVIASFGVVGGVEIRFGCHLRWCLPPHRGERLRENELKFGRSGTSVIRLFTRAAKALAFALAARGEPLFDFAADLDEDADEVRHVAARIVDVRLQQDAVARRLVELDVVPVRQQILELRSVVAGRPANERHPRRIEAELVVPHALAAPSPSPHPVRGSR